jgi:hypothetical protein
MLVTHRTHATFFAALVCSLAGLLPAVAHAADPKRTCVTASTDGQTLRKDDKLLEAREKLLVCADDACPNVVRSHCTHWLSELEAQIPSAIVRVKDAAGGDVLDVGSVKLDGKDAGLGRPERLDPGEHTVTVVRGTVSLEKKFLLVDGDKGHIVTLQLPASASPPEGTVASDTTGSSSSHSSGRIPAGAWVLGGVSLVAIGSFAYFAVQAGNDLSTLRATCAPACTSSQTSTGRTHALLADVSLGVGIAAAGGAIGWAIFGRTADGSAKSGAYLDVRPVAGGAFGTFGFRY